MKITILSLLTIFSLGCFAAGDCTLYVRKILKDHKIKNVIRVEKLRDEDILFKGKKSIVLDTVRYTDDRFEYSSPIIVTENGKTITIARYEGDHGWRKALNLFPYDLRFRGYSIDLQSFRVNKKSKKVYAVYSLNDRSPGPSGFAKSDTMYLVQFDITTGKTSLLIKQDSNRAASREILILDEKRNVIKITGRLSRSSDPYASADERIQGDLIEDTYRVYRNKLQRFKFEEEPIEIPAQIPPLVRLARSEELIKTNDPNIFYRKKNLFNGFRTQTIHEFYNLNGDSKSLLLAVSLGEGHNTKVKGILSSKNPRYSTYKGIVVGSSDGHGHRVKIFKLNERTGKYQLTMEVTSLEAREILKNPSYAFFSSDFDKKLEREFASLLAEFPLK